MKTKRNLYVTMLALVCSALVPGSLTGAEAPKLGVTTQIEITSSYPKRGQGYVYEFEQPIEQGDRLKIFVAPIGGAKLKSEIRVGLPNEKNSRYKAFAKSKAAPSHDWTMPEGAPGDRVWVQIVVFGTGKLDLRVEKVE